MCDFQKLIYGQLITENTGGFLCMAQATKDAPSLSADDTGNPVRAG